MNIFTTLTAPRAILSLSIFRIGLGVFMLLHLFPLIKRISNYHITDNVLYFPHRVFEWLGLLDKPLMFGLVLLAVLTTGLFTAGIKMKWSGLVTSGIYLYFILLE